MDMERDGERERERERERDANTQTRSPMAHILPHWTWPDRVGEVTPVHVFSSADEAELFVNGASQGRRRREPSSYRFRWDDVRYAPGEIRVAAYRDGEPEPWASDSRRTAGAAAALRLTADRAAIAADGRDLAFLTADVVDADGVPVPDAGDTVTFQVVDGTARGRGGAAAPRGEVVATDNGDPADFVEFPSPARDAFSGRALAIVRSLPGRGPGEIVVSATAEGLRGAQITLRAG